MLPELRAEQQLEAIEAAAVPHMKRDDAQSTLRRYQRLTGRVKASARGLGEALASVPMRIIEEPKREETGG